MDGHVQCNNLTMQAEPLLLGDLGHYRNYQKMVGLVQYDGLTVMYVNSTVGLNWPMLTC